MEFNLPVIQGAVSQSRKVTLMQIILASQSPYRQQQLRDFGLEFEIASPRVDEDELKNRFRAPAKLARFLAEEKARSLTELYPRAAIIGADQLVAFKKTILGKPGTREQAIQQLQRLSGKTHSLVTAVAVAHGKNVRSEVVVAKIKMRRLTRDEILASLYRDHPLDCAGSYKLEKSGLSLVAKISVSDPSALMGIPLLTLHRLLKSFKEPLPFRAPAKR